MVFAPRDSLFGEFQALLLATGLYRNTLSSLQKRGKFFFESLYRVSFK